MGIETLKAVQLPEDQDQKQLLDFFLKHAESNLDRLNRMRQALYTLYYALIGAFLSIYYTKASHPELLLFASLAGTVIVIMQIMISFEIASNHQGLNYIFHNIKIVNQLNSIRDKTLEKSFLLQHPYSLALFMINCANLTLIILFGYFIGASHLNKLTTLSAVVFLILTAIVCALYFLTPYFIMRHIKKYHDKYKENVESEIAIHPTSQLIVHNPLKISSLRFGPRCRACLICSRSSRTSLVG
jgi:hypothetical protein